MKIVCLADEREKKVLEARAAGTEVSISWVGTVDGFSDHSDAVAYFDLSFEGNTDLHTGRIEYLRPLLPKPVVINSVIRTLDQIGQPFIRLNAWPGFLERETGEFAMPRGEEKELALVLEKLNWQYRMVSDIPGMVSARIVSAIINEAYYTLQDGVSTKESIDTAMKLGTNYPYGPFEWASLVGLPRIHSLLTVLETTDATYRVCDLLSEEARTMIPGAR